jgi:hypothetical protein
MQLMTRQIEQHLKQLEAYKSAQPTDMAALWSPDDKKKVLLTVMLPDQVRVPSGISLSSLHCYQ